MTGFVDGALGKAIDKDASAVLDYTIDWSSWLDSANSETISSHTVTVGTGLTLDSDSEADGKVTAWLSGGTVGKVYIVACQITTSAGRTDSRRFRVRVKNR